MAASINCARMVYSRIPASKVIGEIQKRRADAGKLVAGVAAASNSDMFKGPVCTICQTINLNTY